MASKQIILNHVWKQGFAKGNRDKTNVNWIDWIFFFSKNVSFVRRDKKKKRGLTKRIINGGHTV